jgi:arylsulfatase
MLAAVLLVPLAGFAAPATEPSRDAAPRGTVLPIPAEPFQGHIGRTVAQSTAAFQQPVHAPAGAPNILLILTDDVGFAASSTFGGPVPTPALDRLAAQGLRFNRFHTTAMCSPTRAALLTGRNHHAVGNGTVADMATGFPGYTSEIPRSAATVAQVLKLHGYNTAFIGKHHNVPASAMSAAGPFDLWPGGLGFEYFYGFLGGDTNQWNPKLYRNNVPVTDSGPAELLDKKFADDAIHWIHNQQAGAQDKPFFLYYAPGTAHAPHQAPKALIEKFKGRFDRGWDALRAETFARQQAAGIVPANAELTPRPALIAAWAALTPEQQRVNARMMEVFAAMLAYQDEQIGRVIGELERMGKLDNTLVVFVEGDNGGSGEGGPDGSANELAGMVNGVHDTAATLAAQMEQMGGPKSYQLYPVGWAWAMGTPFQWTKQVASHFGGTRNGLVISWPAKIKQIGGIRSQFHHVIDIAPTLLDAVGVPQPKIVDGVKQQHVDGISMRYTFDDPKAAERHTTQYFEMLGNRAIYHEGWVANTTPIRGPWQMGDPKEDPETGYRWELYDITRDYSQAHDLAAQHPDKLQALQALWWQEAERNKVLPVDHRNGHARAQEGMKAFPPRSNVYTYWGRDISVPVFSSPLLAMRSFSITADVVLPQTPGQGVVAAVGSWFGGWSFYLDNGRPVAYEAVSQRPEHQFKVVADTALPAGAAQLRFDFDYDGGGPLRGGLMRISVNDKEVARGRIERTIIIPAGLGETFDIGFDTGAPVTDAYRDQGRFNGDIRKVQVELR